jgi:hypothetical protein
LNLTPLKPEGTIDTIFDLDCVVDADGRQKHVDSALARGLPWCIRRKERKGKVAIVASGPSATDYIDLLKDWDGEIWGINGAFVWLRKRGVNPTAFIGLDPEEMLKDYLIETPDVTYYLAVQVHPGVFDHLSGKNVKLWFPADSQVKYPSCAVWSGPSSNVVFGGSTCLGRAPNLAWILGYREVHLFGGDSSFTNKSHVYGDQGELPAGAFPFDLNGQIFITTRQMLQQACEFAEQMVEWARPGDDGSQPLSVYLYGEGLMQEIYRQNFEAGRYAQYLYESTNGGNRKQRRAMKRAS